MSVLLIDVASTSNFLRALSLSYAVCPSSFNDRATMIGSFVASSAVICYPSRLVPAMEMLTVWGDIGVTLEHWF